MVFVKLGVEPALQMSKDDLKVFLQQDGKVM
jgi:helicase